MANERRVILLAYAITTFLLSTSIAYIPYFPVSIYPENPDNGSAVYVTVENTEMLAKSCVFNWYKDGELVKQVKVEFSGSSAEDFMLVSHGSWIVRVDVYDYYDQLINYTEVKFTVAQLQTATPTPTPSPTPTPTLTPSSVGGASGGYSGGGSGSSSGGFSGGMSPVEKEETPTPTLTPTPELTSTPTPIRTPIPMQSPKPELTPTPAKTPTLAPASTPIPTPEKETPLNESKKITEEKRKSIPAFEILFALLSIAAVLLVRKFSQ